MLARRDGQITDGYSYTAFGEAIAHTGPDPQPYAFAGEPYDPNVALQYHRMRWMAPRVGRFAAMDSFEGTDDDPSSLHKYAYVDANPVNKIDPSGRNDYSLGGLITVAAIIGVVNSVATMSYTATVGATKAEIAKAGAIGFLKGAAVGATVYAVLWGGAIAYIGYATGGLTFSQQVYDAFRAGRVYVVRLEENILVYRYAASPSAGPGNWWTTTRFATATDAIEELALPASNTAQYVYQAVIPKGTLILVGEAAPLFGRAGGAVQVFVANVNQVWFHGLVLP